MAKHFGVSVESLFFDEKELYSRIEQEADETETEKIAREIEENEGLRIIFDRTKKATKEDVQKVIDVAQMLFGDEKKGE